MIISLCIGIVENEETSIRTRTNRMDEEANNRK